MSPAEAANICSTEPDSYTAEQHRRRDRGRNVWLVILQTVVATEWRTLLRLLAQENYIIWCKYAKKNPQKNPKTLLTPEVAYNLRLKVNVKYKCAHSTQKHSIVIQNNHQGSTCYNCHLCVLFQENCVMQSNTSCSSSNI